MPGPPHDAPWDPEDPLTQWLPTDWDNPRRCTCGHTEYQHMNDHARPGVRTNCLYEGDRPAKEQCRRFTYDGGGEQLTVF
jgi:hypothetical protein